MSEVSFEQMLEESLKTISRGEVVEGTVITVNPEEAALNIGYKADGILTRGEYSNEPVDLTTVLKEGDKLEGALLFKCKHLKNNKCSIYLIRPLFCRDYPDVN